MFKKIPLSIAKYIRSIKLAETMLAYLSVNEDESLTNWGGEIHYYGLSNLNIGQPVTEKLTFFGRYVASFRCLDITIFKFG